MTENFNESSVQDSASQLTSSQSIQEAVLLVGSRTNPTSDFEVFYKEVFNTLVSDNLPPTPHNFFLYFDRILKEKSENFRRQIGSILELESDNKDEKILELEKTLKQGFSSVKSILQLTATLYNNMVLMDKILAEQSEEIKNVPSPDKASYLLASLTNDVSKLSGILNKQVSHMKDLYNKTATIVKQVENETIFDNQYDVYNKRYLLNKLSQEFNLIEEFNHKSSLIMIQLSNATLSLIDSEKVKGLMARTVARLLIKISRRSDILAHYGQGIFFMMLKNADIDNAKITADRLYELVSSSNFFMGDQEIQIQIAIGISQLNPSRSIEEILVGTLDAMYSSNDETKVHYVVYND